MLILFLDAFAKALVYPVYIIVYSSICCFWLGYNTPSMLLFFYLLLPLVRLRYTSKRNFLSLAVFYKAIIQPVNVIIVFVSAVFGMPINLVFVIVFLFFSLLLLRRLLPSIRYCLKGYCTVFFFCFCFCFVFFTFSRNFPNLQVFMREADC